MQAPRDISGPVCFTEQCLAASQGAGPGHLEITGGQLLHQGQGREVQQRDQPQEIVQGLDPGQGLNHQEEKGQGAMTEPLRKAVTLGLQCLIGGAIMETGRNQNPTSVWECLA